MRQLFGWRTVLAPFGFVDVNRGRDIFAKGTFKPGRISNCIRAIVDSREIWRVESRLHSRESSARQRFMD